jgi:hypothetical protein
VLPELTECGFLGEQVPELTDPYSRGLLALFVVAPRVASLCKDNRGYRISE